MENINLGDPADTSSWPKHVKQMGIGSFEHFGIDAENNIYFDGKKVQYESRLALPERIMASAAAAATVVVAFVEIGRSAGWWGG